MAAPMPDPAPVIQTVPGTILPELAFSSGEFWLINKLRRKKSTFNNAGWPRIFTNFATHISLS
ncbi:hypothetical protein N7376_11690 [Brucella intermedia GD04153]|uniref:Uncharacterized protein n=1 Tax=Brucella intermedia GD04153 TaxID=2975438 RepID=A0AA42KTM1_9HYPH|nr:hypothetical protein [Brucella intermedia]MDH0124657.1 hypothetical protein [Brucella intermedia GD04153]